MPYDKACDNCGEAYTARNHDQKYCGAKCRGRAFYARNPEYCREKSRKYRQVHGYGDWPSKRALGLEIAALKSTNPCMDCGGVFPQECMDFDHRPGETKVKAVGTMVAHGHNKEKVYAEIAKCDLVCANCHRTRTKKRRSGVGRVRALAQVA